MAVQVLPEFQAFLRTKKIVPDKQIPFYAQWVSRFLSFLNRNSFTKLDIATEQFIIWLRDSQHVQDWQLRQAENAVRLYAGSFADGNASVVLPAAARDYVTRLEELVGVRAGCISVGPDREALIRR